MSGATSRRRGHQFERDIATELANVLDLDIRTARSVTGGRQSGADLVTVDSNNIIDTVEGWSIEVKASTDGHEPTAWMRQAKRQSDSPLYCVIAKVPNRPIRDATVYLTCRALRWWVGDNLAVYEPDDTTTSLSFGAFQVLLQMDIERHTDG